MTDHTKLITLGVLVLIVIGGVAAYAGATNTFSIGDGNGTVNATNETYPIETDNVTINTTSEEVVNTSTEAPPNTTVINNNNYVTVNNTIQVPASIQPSITPTQASTDNSLQKTTVVKEKTVIAPEVVQQRTVTIKTSDLYTGQMVKVTQN